MSYGESAYEAVSVEEFLEYQGVDYRRTSGSRGAQFNVKECPACGGSEWKVYLNVENGFGNCFHGSCQARFNLWTFAAACLQTSDKKAVSERFAEIAKLGGWKPRNRPAQVSAPVFDGDLTLPPSFALPTEDGRNLTYLEERGITTKLAEYFHLRYCHEGWWRYFKEDGAKGGVNFAQRVIIPIYDLNGDLETFQGRDITGTSDRKYLFPPRLPGTGRFLYNGHNALANRAKHVVMGEGAFDVCAIKKALDADRAFAGIVPIGSFGMHLSANEESADTNDQLGAFMTLRKAGLQTVTIMWDGERKANQRALEAAALLKRYGLITRIAFLPQGKDPGEVPPDIVREAVANAKLFDRTLLISLKIRKPYVA